MLEKRGIVDEENTRPEPKPKCCGGSCHPSPKELEEHLTKRASDAACNELKKQE